MNLFSEKYLPLSKWTATTSINNDTHFLVTYTYTDAHGHVTRVGLQGVNNRLPVEMTTEDLKDSDRWHMGWV